MYCQISSEIPLSTTLARQGGSPGKSNQFSLDSRNSLIPDIAALFRNGIRLKAVCI